MERTFSAVHPRGVVYKSEMKAAKEALRDSVVDSDLS